MANKYFMWLRTEYKRAALLLPFVLKRAVILAAVCLAAGGIIAFCVFTAGKDTGERLRIGYTASDDMLTNFAVSYVQDMESVRSLCSLEPVTEQEGKRLLWEGSLSALIVLPEDVMNEILSGSNTPAVLYLPERGGSAGAVGEMLFEELVSAAIGMLGTAQAEIYASYSVLQEMGAAGDGALQSVYDDINKFNLATVTSREDLFRTKRLSITGNDTYAVYFGSAFLTVYALFSGLFAGEFFRRSVFWQRMADRRLGVGYVLQLMAGCLAGCFLMLVVVLFPAGVFALVRVAVPRLGEVLSVRISPAGAAGLLMIAVFMAVYNMMLYQMMEKRGQAVVVTGILALLQAYVSGCLVPSVLLPEAVAAAGRLTPAAFIKQGFTSFLTGGTKGLAAAASGLAAWGLVLFFVTVILIYVNDRERPSGGIKCRQARKIHVPSVCAVLFRRLLHRKSMWLSMLFFASASVGIVQAEKKSEIQIRAAVYDESGDYAGLLENYDGLVSFRICDSREEVMDAVLRGNAECGYVLPQSLAEDIAARRANQSITVYQDEDAVAVPVVNEILFERIFRRVSLAWYTDYAGGLGTDKETLRRTAQEYFDRELSEGTTFRFEVERVGIANNEWEETQDKGNRTVYSVSAAAAAVVILCALQGVAQTISDIRHRRFYKRSRAAMALLTAAMPVLAGILVSLAAVYAAAWLF